MRNIRQNNPAASSAEITEGYTGELVDLERVYEALESRFDAAQLTEEEQDYFWELYADQINNPTPEEVASFEAYLDKHGRGPGYDEAGNLVQTERDGSVTVLKSSKLEL